MPWNAFAQINFIVKPQDLKDMYSLAGLKSLNIEYVFTVYLKKTLMFSRSQSDTKRLSQKTATPYRRCMRNWLNNYCRITGE